MQNLKILKLDKFKFQTKIQNVNKNFKIQNEFEIWTKNQNPKHFFLTLKKIQNPNKFAIWIKNQNPNKFEI
jgi:hypothetical protein